MYHIYSDRKAFMNNDADFEKFLNDDNDDDEPKMPIPCLINSILREKSNFLSNLLDSSLQAYNGITNDTFRGNMELFLNKLMEQSLQTLNQFDYLSMECEDDGPPPPKDLK